MAEAEKELPPPSTARAIINLIPLLILTWYLCQNRPDQNPQFQLEQCAKHLHEIGVALEKDRLSSEDKLYNKDLEAAVGKDKLPGCPVGGKSAYIDGYKVSADRKSYLLVCKGDHHKAANVPSDYPRIGFSVQEAQAEATSDEKQEQKREQPEEAGQSPTPSQTVQESPTPQGSVSPTPKATPDAK